MVDDFSKQPCASGGEPGGAPVLTVVEPDESPTPSLIPPEAATSRTFTGRVKSALRRSAMRSAGRIAVGLHRRGGHRSGSQIGILTYHRIAPHTAGVPAPSHNVEPHRFHEQITGLLRAGFEFRPLSAVLHQSLTGEVLADRTAVVTFDDGFQTVFTQAFRVLREYHIPFTLFVNTAYLDQHDPFPFDAWGREFTGRVPEEHTRALTSLECRTMLDGGLMELGAHTHTHADFRSRPQALRRDLAECVRRLRTGFGIENPSFAFPFGSRKEGFASDELIEAARYCGVSCALSTECSPVDPQSDPFTWGRYNVFAWDTSATLAAKLAGWYDWAPQGWCGIVGRFR